MSKIEDAMEKADDERRKDGEADESAVVVQPLDEEAQIDERVVSYHNPRGMLAECFKQFRLVMRSLTEDPVHKMLIFTSSLPGEGKTTLALNFAIAMAQDIHEPVCIVDGDLRHPSMHSLLGVRPARGLADVLAGAATLDDVILDTPTPGLSFVPAGQRPANPGELVSSHAMDEVIATLKERFAAVIFDSPPVLPVADTIQLSSRADGLILVIEAGRTHRKRVQRALELLDGAPILGFVLNKGELTISDYSYRTARD